MTRKASPEDAIIGKRIRAARLAADLSQTDLGEMIGVRFQQVQKYETGLNRISASRLILAAKSLRVDITTLLPIDTGNSVFDDPDAMRAAMIVSCLPPQAKVSAGIILAAILDGVQQVVTP